MEKARKGDWVQVHQVIFSPGERSPNIPEETKKVPLELRVKGWLEIPEAQVGEEAVIKTPAGRELEGRLVAVNPPFTHGFGKPVQELLEIGPELRALLREEGAK